MRKIEYTEDMSPNGPAYLQCEVDGDFVFIINVKAEARLQVWERSMMWNEITAKSDGPALRRRQRSHEAEIIDIDELRARRMGGVRRARS